MANKAIFKVQRSTKYVADTKNEAGGLAYSFTDEHALAQYAVTGCFSNTFYANAEDQLNKVQELALKCSSEFIAKLAVYSREKGHMKDMPAFLLAVLAARKENVLLNKVFNKVVTNTKMLCNFVQIVRSGVTGRKSFGTAVKRLIKNWLVSQSADKLFNSSIGRSNPSLVDVIKMVHPKAENDSQNALFAYLLDKDHSFDNLPENVKEFERFKKDNTLKLPNVPFMALSNCKLNAEQWRQIGRDMPWNTLRMNLNMLGRNGVFDDDYEKEIANKLRDPKLVRKSNVFPYQLLTAYQNTTEIPSRVSNALQDALDIAVENVPAINGKVAVCVDTSGSMMSSVTGNRGSVTSKTSCLDVAGLIAACFVRKNEGSEIVPFDTDVRKVNYNERDSVMTNARKFALRGGGTDLSCAMRYLNNTHSKSDLVIFVSDNESWAGMDGRYGRTGMADEWLKFKRRNPKAKLVLIDLQPYGTTQVKDDKSVLNIGGFSDAVFDVIAAFANGQDDHFVDVINQVNID